MRVFLAGIMQGSIRGLAVHEQDYRGRLKEIIEGHLADAEVYDPFANHNDSINYGEDHGRQVFFGHNLMCREVDLLVAYAPEASMGTAIEMWEAYQHGAFVVAVSPMKHNWAIKFLSHVIYADLESFVSAVESGELAEKLAAHRKSNREQA